VGRQKPQPKGGNASVEAYYLSFSWQKLAFPGGKRINSLCAVRLPKTGPKELECELGESREALL
jgi:hypothetical protein